MRRLPIFVLIDTSEAMQGNLLDSVSQKLRSFHTELMTDAFMVETAFLSIITFGSSPHQLSPLTEVHGLQVPVLESNGVRNLGLALECLCDCVKNEVRGTTMDRKGDYDPRLLMFIAGNPPADCEHLFERLRGTKIARFVSVQLGDSPDPSVLRQLGCDVLPMDQATPERLRKLLEGDLFGVVATQWMSHPGQDRVGRIDLTYDIFISSKSDDYKYARVAAVRLQEAGLRVFFSEQALPEMGNSDYFDAIDKALEACHHMLVVTSSYAHVTGQWVKKEWQTYLNEKLSGRKRGNIVTLLCGDMKITDLPISLRQHEARRYDEFSSVLLYFKDRPA